MSTLALTGLSFTLVALAMPAGPEVVTHDVTGLATFAPLNGERAVAAGGAWCNLGDTPAPWSAISANHPVTATNLLRVEQGALRHIGASWAWHHVTCPLQTALCAACQPEGGGCPDALGSGCSTASTAATLGGQAALGMRSLVNAATAEVPFPIVGPPIADTLARRCRYALSDVDPAMHRGAAFAVQTVTVAASGDASDRSALREVAATTLANGGGEFLSPATLHTSAVDFWRSIEPSVAIAAIDLPTDGRVLVASRVEPTANGFRYDYAIENLSSHESIGGFAVPVALGLVTAPMFAAPLAHSGETTGNDPWISTVSVDSISWTTTPFAVDANANAIRWGTTYSFAFESTQPPAPRQATLTTFRSGKVTVAVVFAPRHVADLDGDGSVGSADLGLLLGAWGRCGACPSDINDDGFVDSVDLGMLLGAWN